MPPPLGFVHLLFEGVSGAGLVPSGLAGVHFSFEGVVVVPSGVHLSFEGVVVGLEGCGSGSTLGPLAPFALVDLAGVLAASAAR